MMKRNAALLLSLLATFSLSGAEKDDHDEHEEDHDEEEEEGHDEHEEDHDDADGEHYVEVIGSCLLVCLVTLVGVAFLGAKSATASKDMLSALNGFASGALLACGFFLMIPEALHMISDEFSEETDATWRFGTAVLAGFLAPLVFKVLGEMAGFDVGDVLRKCAQGSKTGAEESGVEMTATDKKDGDAAMVVSANESIYAVLVGDWFHNFADGVLIGAAFKACDQSVAWGIVAATIGHEIPQEVADYVVLVSPPISFAPMTALGMNFIAGLSVIIGGIVITAIDVGEATLGILLGLGAGTYLYLGTLVCLPNALEKYGDNSFLNQQIKVLGAFTLGAVAIGLILLNHEHCGGHDEHESHDH